jgi:hypothetical protein
MRAAAEDKLVMGRLPTVKALTIRPAVGLGRDLRGQRCREPPVADHVPGAAADPRREGPRSRWLRVAVVDEDPEAFGHPKAAWEARGAIIGLVFLADVLTDSPNVSRWAVPGWYHWVFEFPSTIAPRSLPGDGKACGRHPPLRLRR